ncbi:MAG TPA: Rnf-Nqr domain containing protein [Spirochaetota bacterium]|nr:electron transport complex subunit RsxA [Spirochaetota bacterium]HOK03390.1 Rnf-Nqr domain containing protein [Spirochaetota bacterium]HON17395.1 Rnf-Nqr domain containing protein [Spirochaetota bacterium]HRS63106.1 Rnf-Nqr domain containing protein [Spirochaetota bacterium]
MKEYFLLFVGAAIVNNFVLTRYLGLCIFFGVSKNFHASSSMGLAIISVITMSSMLTWVIEHFILIPLGVLFLKTIVFVVVIAVFVQLLEMVIKKFMPTLYNIWGIYLLLVATNCVILGVPLINSEAHFDFIKSTVNALGSGTGFAIALILFASLREKAQFSNIPKSLEGLGIAFILAGMLALAFQGFGGMIPL